MQISYMCGKVASIKVSNVNELSPLRQPKRFQ